MAASGQALVLLVLLRVTVAAQDALVGSPESDVPSCPTLSRAYHWLGTGRFQCGGIPWAMDINPSGTALIVYGGITPGPLRLFSIPDGASVPIPADPAGVPDDARAHGRVHWIDDERVIVNADSIIRDFSIQDTDHGLSWGSDSYLAEVLQVIDTRSGTRKTFELPRQAYAASFILTHDGRYAIFPCPMPSMLCAAIDEERPRSRITAWGMGILDLSTGSLRRGFCPLPLDQRFLCTSYAISADDRFLAMLVHKAAPDGDYQGSIIQWWDVEHNTLLRSFPIPNFRQLCDLRVSADDQLEFLYTDPVNGVIPLTTTMSLSTGALRETRGWTIRVVHGARPRVLATIGQTALTLPDQRSISLHDHERPAPVSWYDLCAAAPSVNGHITCDRRGRYYAIAYGECINLIDLTHAWMRPQPDSAWYSSPRSCQYRDDGALVVTTASQVVIEHPDGSQMVCARPLDCDWPTAGGFSGGLLAVRILPTIDPSQRSVVWDARTRSVVRCLDPVTTDSISISPHQQWCCYRQRGGQVVLADLLHAQRPEAALDVEDPRAACENVFWSDDERMVCLTRSHQSAGTSARSVEEASAWDCQSGRRRWRPCTATGEALEDVADLIPSADGRLVLAMQRTLRPVPPLSTPPLLAIPDLVAPPDYPTVLLDGRDGRVLRTLEYPGHGTGFTPDGTRVVGSQCVLRVADNRRLWEVAHANVEDQFFDSSPTRTWLVVGRGMHMEAIIDSAGAGIVLPIPLEAVPGPVADFVNLTWNPGEDHLAVTATVDARVLEVDLYPSPPAASDLHGALLELERDHDGWLLAACALSRCGEPAVAALRSAPPSAHGIIALERCAAAGVPGALAVLAAQRALPGALGLLAGDAYARQQRSLRARALAQAERPMPAP